MTNPDTAATRTFAGRQRDAALEILAARMERERRVTKAVLGERNHREYVSEIVTVDADRDDHIVEIAHTRAGLEKAWWATVAAGRDDRIRFNTRDMALLHLIARRVGTDDTGTTATYAARILGCTDTPTTT